MEREEFKERHIVLGTGAPQSHCLAKLASQIRSGCAEVNLNEVQEVHQVHIAER